MGKGGKGKLKTYKPPPEKFVVVYKAWGVNPSNAKVTCNQIAAWFEVMLRERYPDTRPYSIYYQPKKLHYFIVELPSNVDINPYLGTHSYDSFLKGIQTSPNDVACLYEYNYKSFGDPSKVWNQGFAEYTKIPEGFPVRSPYPIPGPAVPPPGDLPSAIYPPRMPALPPQIPANPPPVAESPSGILDSSAASSSRNPQAPETPSIPQAVEPDRQRSPTSSLTPPLAPEEEREQAPPTEVSTFQPYEPPNHYQKPTSPSPTPTPGSPIPSSSEVTPGLSTKLQKWDPYEEEEAAEALLRASMPNNDEVTNDDDIKPSIKDEPDNDIDSLVDYDEPEPASDHTTSTMASGLHPRQEDDERALDFLQSTIPLVKSEPVESFLPPAADGLSRSATLDSSMDEDEDEDDDYVPSAELAAAFAAMANGAMVTTSVPMLAVKSEPNETSTIPHIKPEPQDVDMGSLSADSRGRTSSTMTTSRSSTLGTEPSVPPSQTTSTSRSATVKSEDTETRRPSLFSTPPLVKPEPIEAVLPPPPSGVKRPPQANESSTGQLRFKKVKREM